MPVELKQMYKKLLLDLNIVMTSFIYLYSNIHILQYEVLFSNI